MRAEINEPVEDLECKVKEILQKIKQTKKWLGNEI